MELNQLNIYADNYHEPDLVLTYTLKEKTDEIDMFKIWISNIQQNNLELINYANLILYNVIINNDKPNQKDIYITYQKLFSNKIWRPYTELTTYVNNIKTLTKPPYNNYKELTKKVINEKIKGMYDKYIKKGE